MDNYIERINKIQKQLKKDLIDSNEENACMNMSKYNFDLFAEYLEHFRQLYIEEGSKFNADKKDIDESYWNTYLPNVWLNQILQFILMEIFNNDIELTKQTLSTQLEMIKDVIENEENKEDTELYTWLDNLKPSDF